MTTDILNDLGFKFEIPLIHLPIGISFFTFQAISYIVDIYRGKGEVQTNPLNVGLYISLFPQLIAGPIVRYETVAIEINQRRISMSDFSEGAERFIWGLAKKILLANNMAILTDCIFGLHNDYLTMPLTWLGAIAYTLQIYFDFSGYSDMAIGLGRMFGFHFNENFNYPYISKSISEFWRRWHISLGTWFKDYVYIPLGGSRKGICRTIINLLIVWALTGLWHGANLTFLVWGLWFFGLLMIEKISNIEKKRTYGITYLYTLVAVIIGWVLFRAESFPKAFEFIQTMFSLSKFESSDLLLIYWGEMKVWLLLSCLFSFPIIQPIYKKHIKPHSIINSIILLGVTIMTVTYITKGGYNPFIYFNF